MFINKTFPYDGHDDEGDEDAYDLHELSCGFYANAEFYERITESMFPLGATSRFAGAGSDPSSKPSR